MSDTRDIEPVTARLTLSLPGRPDIVAAEHVIEVQPTPDGDVWVDVAEVLRQMLDESLTPTAPQAERTEAVNERG